jgi:hypothetical protein
VAAPLLLFARFSTRANRVDGIFRGGRAARRGGCCCGGLALACALRRFDHHLLGLGELLVAQLAGLVHLPEVGERETPRGDGGAGVGVVLHPPFESRHEPEPDHQQHDQDERALDDVHDLVRREIR